MNLAKIALFSVAIIWGSSFAFQKGLLEFIDPVIFTFYNFLLVGILFLIYVIYHKKNLFYRYKEGLTLGLLIAGTEVMQMVGLHLSTAANTSFISNIGMLFIPYLGYLLYKHKVTFVDGTAVVGAGIGMYFLVGGIDGFKIGDIFLLLSACFMAFYFLLSERYESEKGGHMSVICAQQFLVVSFLTGVYALFFDLSFIVDENILNTLLWQILIFTTVPYFLIQWSSKYSDEITITMYDGVVEPLVGGLVAWGLFFEEVTFVKIIGALIMVVSFGISAVYTRNHSLLKRTIKK